MTTTRLALFLQSDSPERIRTAASILASAAALDWDVTAVFLGGALKRLVEGRLNEGSPSGESGPDGLIQSARSFGRLTVMACTADAQSTGLSREAILRHVDEIAAMPTILLRIEGAPTKLFL